MVVDTGGVPWGLFVGQSHFCDILTYTIRLHRNSDKEIGETVRTGSRGGYTFRTSKALSPGSDLVREVDPVCRRRMGSVSETGEGVPSLEVPTCLGGVG